MLTNGVDFSLVAGACCWVVFSNKISGTGKYNDLTLNINSTGAKGIVNYRLHQTDSYGARNTVTMHQGLELPYLLPVVYTGTTYAWVSMYTYSDYSDG